MLRRLSTLEVAVQSWQNPSQDSLLAKSQDSLGRPLHEAPAAAGPLMTLSVISSISDDAVDCVGRSDEPADPNRDVLSSATAGGWEGEKKDQKRILMKPSLCHSVAKRMEGLECGGADKQRQVGRHRNCLDLPHFIFHPPTLYVCRGNVAPGGLR